MGNAATADRTADTAAQAAELRRRAVEARRASARSFEDCDTDGFMSQWASNLTARELELEADLLENGGRAAFPTLFDTDGNLVPAVMMDVRRDYGRTDTVFRLLDDNGRRTGWFNPSKAQTPGVARRNDARKGYYIGYALVPAKAAIRGGGTGLAGAASCTVGPVRLDDGFTADIVVVDNGQGDTDLNQWYGVQDGTAL